MRVRTTLTYGSGGPGLATHYFRPGTAGGVSADALDVVARVRAFWAAVASAYTNASTFQVQSDVALIEDTSGGLVGTLAGGTPAAVVGASATGIAPIASMALLRARTNVVVNNRLLRGRQYMGPIRIGAVTTTGQLATGEQTTITSAANAMITPASTTSFPVVWHRPGTTGGISAAVVSYAAWNELAVLRSRRDG